MRFNLVIIDVGPVGTVKVHHIQLDPVTLGLIWPGVWHQPVLQCCVLLAAARMVQGNVCHLPVSTQEVGRLSVNVEDWELF